MREKSRPWAVTLALSKGDLKHIGKSMDNGESLSLTLIVYFAML